MLLHDFWLWLCAAAPFGVAHAALIFHRWARSSTATGRTLWGLARYEIIVKAIFNPVKPLIQVGYTGGRRWGRRLRPGHCNRRLRLPFG